MAKGINQGSSSQKRIAQLQAEQAGLEKTSKEYLRIQDIIDKINRKLENSVENIEEFSDSVKSLGAYVGKSNKLFETMNLLSDSMQASMISISGTLKAMPAEAGKFKKEAYKATDAYKRMGNVMAVNMKKLKKQQITTTQYNESILDSYDDLEESIERLESQLDGLTGTARTYGEVALRTFKGQKDALEAAAKAAEKSKNQLEGMGFALDTISSTGIPGMNELSKIITTSMEGGKGLTLAFAALGAALGKMAYDLGFFGDKLKTVAKYDGILAGINAQIETINKKVDLGLFGGRNFVAEEAAMDFGLAMTNARLEFEAASKTALFGNGLGSVQYGAAQLQMAGISAEKIAGAMKETSQLMGSNVSAKFGANVAILAQRTGQSEGSIAAINDYFMRASNTSAEVALNMQEGMRAMAEQANINLGALMEDVAEASKNALSYQIKSGPALAKAAAFANSIGVKFTSIAEAGKNMVLNYKDSIKAEMSLSAMLGRRVDLSQVRALFASGDTKGAMKALKAQGLNPANMNMFQQQQLSQALGGANLDDLQKIATRTGREAGLGQGNVGIGNQGFLSRNQAAESAKQIGMAVASALAAVAKSEKLQGPIEQQRQRAIEENTGGLKDLMYARDRTETVKTIALGIGAAIPMLVGALALRFGGRALMGLLKGAAPGLSNIFKGGTAAAGATAGVANSGLKMVKGGLVQNAQGKFVSRAQADAFKASQGWVQAKSGVYYKPGSSQANAIMAAKGGMTGGVAPTSLATGVANTAKVGFGGKVASNLAGGVKGVGGVLSVLTAALDYKSRKEAGQTTLQAASGAGGGATGALAGAALGSAIVPVVGTIIGGAIGYWAGSSLADTLTGANEPTVEAQEETQAQVELSNQQLQTELKNGKLLDANEYSVELQQKMLVMMGLQIEYLNDIAISNRTFNTVNLDGKKVLDLLNSRVNKGYGVTRLASVNRKVG